MSGPSTSGKHRILVVDDSPTEIQTLLGILKSRYTITVATSGESTLSRLENADKDLLPEIVLLDINMPGIDGYETCRRLKSNSQLKDIDIIFFSANDSTEEITKGFDLGACDYIVKPFDSKILVSKLDTALKNKVNRSSLTHAASTANSIAMSAMRDSGDLGIIVSFLRSCFGINNLEELANQIIESLQCFSLNACTLVYSGVDNAIAGSDNTISELEITLLQRLKGNVNSIHEHNRKLIIGRDGIALIIKNLPEDKENSDRLKDHIMTLIEGIQNKVSQINLNQVSKSSRHSNIRNAVIQAHQSLTDIQKQQQVHKEDNVKILDTMVHDVEEAFISMGLTHTQEESILSILTNAATTTLDHFEKGVAIDKELEKIVNELSNVVMNNAH